MPAPVVHTPKTLTDYISLIEGLRSSLKTRLWYRGCGRADYTLLPSLYRHRTKNNIHALVKLEMDMLIRFKQRSIPMHSRSFTDDWDVLFFMQHYNIPTRLLDWSENPLVGLYFAVMSPSWTLTTRGKKKFDDSSAVWILDPVSWNRHALSHQSYDGDVLMHADQELSSYSPRRTVGMMNEPPVALFGDHNSPRIVAQRGVFTIFGQNLSPMENIYMQKQFPVDCLQKVVLSKSCLPQLYDAILDHGLTEAYMFPDLEGLALETKRLFGF